MRAWVSFCFALVLLLALTGCGNDTAKRISAAHAHAEELESQINDLKDKIDKLQDEVDRFDDTSWREVVPEVRQGVSDIEGDSQELADKAGELTGALESLETDTTPNEDDGG